MDTIKKNNKKKIIILAVIVFTLLAMAGYLCILMFHDQSVSSKWVSDAYVYENNLPSSDEPEEWIHLDGELSESQWQDNSWMNYSSYGVTFGVTTEFTEEGMYIGGKADDPYICFDADFQYKNATYFKIHIVREDDDYVTQSNLEVVRPGSRLCLMVDPVNTASFTNVPVTSATSVQGTLNTTAEGVYHETESWSFELFISWESMQLEEKYYAEDGIPNNMKLFVGYNKVDGENEVRINNYIEPLNTQSHRFNTYWMFGRQGLEGDYSSLVLNNAQNGPAATDQLSYTVDKDGDLVVTNTASRLQYTWAQGPASENFLIEATFKAGDFTDIGYFGLGFLLYDSINSAGGYNVFCAKADTLKQDDTLLLCSASVSDAIQWMGTFSIYEKINENYHSPHGDDSVRLKLIKVGGNMYYFVDNQFVKAEYIDRLSGAVNAGLYFNVRATATDYRYVDYSENKEEIIKELGEYVYFVNVPGTTSYGSITSDVVAVPKGDPVTVNIHPSSGYIFGDIYNNKKSIMKDVEEAVYTFTPTEDVNITVDYHRLDAATEACKINLKIENEDGEVVSGTTYTLSDKNGNVVYTGQDNGRGKIIVSVPNQGTIQTKTQSLKFSGSYILTLTKDGYISKTFEIKVGNKTEYEDTLKFKENKYGTVTVNGVGTSDASGEFDFSTSKDLYYSPAKTKSGREVAYHKNYIANQYSFTANIFTEDTSGVPGVPGVAITIGGGQTIILKFSPWGADRLFISNGVSEVSVTGFTHTISEKDGSVAFSVVRKGEQIHVYNSNGELGVILSATGVQTVGGHELYDKQGLNAVNKTLSIFFGTKGMDNVVGIYNDYNNGTGNTYFDIKWKK